MIESSVNLNRLLAFFAIISDKTYSFRTSEKCCRRQKEAFWRHKIKASSTLVRVPLDCLSTKNRIKWILCQNPSNTHTMIDCSKMNMSFKYNYFFGMRWQISIVHWSHYNVIHVFQTILFSSCFNILVTCRPKREGLIITDKRVLAWKWT